MAHGPLVSAVVINWNGASHLEVCLPSLLAQSHESLEILVVDNGSNDDSEEVVRRHPAQWLPLGRNLGLAPAMNRGAARAHGEILLFLNNDMRFHPEFVRSLVGELTKSNEVFAVDALQYDWDGQQPVHLATSLARKPGAGELSERIAPGLYLNQKATPIPTTVVMASAANMMVKNQMFTALGGFDERLPAGYEDLDICWRAWVRGWKTIFVPSAICWHKVGATSQSAQGSRMRFRGSVGGRLVFATKLLPLSYTLITWLVSIAGLGRDVRRKMPWGKSAVGERFGVLRDNLHHLPSLIVERQDLFDGCGITPGKALARLFRLPEPASL
jgi:GT2 family glycosyltransferase